VADGDDRDYEGGDYKVGYGKPPLYTRFRRGHSGNPSGRPRGSRSTGALLREILQTKVKVNKSGKMMSKREVIITQQVNKAVAGDRQAAYLVFAIDASQPNESPRKRTRGLSDETSERIRAALCGQPWIDPRKKSS
jgi:hypothetical protein